MVSSPTPSPEDLTSAHVEHIDARMTKTASVSARVNMVWRGDELSNLRECMALLRLNDEAATVRYLVGRGMEAMATPLAARRMFSKLEAQYSPQQMLPILQEMGVKLE